MADNHAISCLVGIMDQLWFHQVILLPKILQQSPPSMASASSSEDEQLSNIDSSARSSGTQVISEENSAIFLSDLQDEDDDEYCYSNKQESNGKERPKRLKLSAAGGETRCSSCCSPISSRKRRAEVYPGGARRRLSRTLSCKSLCELEFEEVKGFMDLGFTFNKEHLNKRMMSVIPGLQRLDLMGCHRINNDDDDHQNRKTTEEEEEEEERGGITISRPYLSEAWLVRRPDSPLLKMRIPRVSTADDMKKHLKYWAKTVASAIQLESY